MRYWSPRKVPGNPLVGVQVATYLESAGDRRARALEGLVASLRAQTYANWRAVVVHDGPAPRTPEFAAFTAALTADARVEFHTTQERKQHFGHHHRPWAVDRLLAQGAHWVGLTNDDNYYVPVYLEWMLAAALAKKAQLVYCDCVHSHRQWRAMTTQPRRGKIDLGGFLVARDLAARIKFDKFTFSGDGDYVNRLQQAAGKRVEKVPAILFVHN